MRRSYVLSFLPLPRTWTFSKLRSLDNTNSVSHCYSCTCLLSLSMSLSLFSVLYALAFPGAFASFSSFSLFLSDPLPPVIARTKTPSTISLMQAISYQSKKEKKPTQKTRWMLRVFHALGSGMGIPATVFSFIFCFDCLHAGVCVCVCAVTIRNEPTNEGLACRVTPGLVTWSFLFVHL